MKFRNLKDALKVLVYGGFSLTKTQTVNFFIDHRTNRFAMLSADRNSNSWKIIYLR